MILHILNVLMVFLMGWSNHANSKPIYIEVGKANFKKVNFAISINSSPLSSEVNMEIVRKLDFSDLFNLIPIRHREGRIDKSVLSNIRISTNADFWSLVNLQTNNEKQTVALRLYDLNKMTEILSDSFLVPSHNAHVITEEIAARLVETLTSNVSIYRSRILMTCGSGKIREIYSIDPTGKSVYRHTNDKNLALSPAWSRDNRSIAYTSYTKENKRKFVNPNLYIQDLSTGKRNLVSSQIGMNSGASFSQNDNLLAYTFSGTKIPEIYILNLAQKVRYKITNSFAFAVEPTWSPDGSKLAFSQRTYGNPHIWISDANGQQRRQLTKAGKYNSTPAWSPDGKTIAFAGQENDSTEFNIFTVNLRTGEIQRVTSDDYSNENPSYSPDGRFLAMASKINGKYRIRVVNLQTGRSAIISPLSLGECKQPAWSFGKTQYLN